MRILLMGSCQVVGGTKTHFQLLLKFLLSEKHDVFAIGVCDSDSQLPQMDEFNNLVRIRHSSSNLTSKLLKAVRLLQLQSIIASFKPEIFIAASIGNTYVTIARSLSNKTFSVHQELINNPPPSDPLRMRVVKAFDAVAVQSPSMRLPYLANIKTTKPVGCLPCLCHAPITGYVAKLPKASEPIRLAYFGRLAANKGIPLFLKAFAQVSHQINANLNIHGDGPERNLINEAIRTLNLSHCVKLYGSYPTGEAYAQLLSSYHALILPSIDSEGLPLILLEAMSYGLPFLATQVGAISDSAVDNLDVLVVEPLQSSLANGLLKLVQMLKNGQLDPKRLQNYYYSHFSQTVMELTWRSMLENPQEFFKS